MAAQASEAFAVAGRTGGFIEIQLARSMTIEKIGRVVGRLEVHCRSVALRATKRRIDLGVANEAVFHVREIGFRQWPGSYLEAAMTCLAGVLGNQIGAEFQEIDLVW